MQEKHNGPKEYRYYRCTKYNHRDHPRIRLREADLNRQILAYFEQLRIEDEDICSGIVSVLRAKQAKLKRKQGHLLVELAGRSRQKSERTKLAVKVFELSQTLKTKWDTVDVSEKRLLLEIVCLNFYWRAKGSQ